MVREQPLTKITPREHERLNQELDQLLPRVRHAPRAAEGGSAGREAAAASIEVVPGDVARHHRRVESILEAIGNTPLVRLRGCAPPNGAARDEGIFAGISTAANVVGAHRLAARLGRDAVIVTLAVDTGFKHMSTRPYADT